MKKSSILILSLKKTNLVSNNNTNNSSNNSISISNKIVRIRELKMMDWRKSSRKSMDSCL